MSNQNNPITPIDLETIKIDGEIPPIPELVIPANITEAPLTIIHAELPNDQETK